MVFDLDLIRKVYSELPRKVGSARNAIGRPLTQAEKILYSHSFSPALKAYARGKDYVDFAPDRVAMQDATAQMALLQFDTCGRKRVAVPSTVHCDHLIQAKLGAVEDLNTAIDTNREVYDFLASISNKYGIGFWKPGAGIIHQVVLENYAFPGGMMIGTDSHTVNAGGLGMVRSGGDRFDPPLSEFDFEIDFETSESSRECQPVIGEAAGRGPVTGNRPAESFPGRLAGL